MTRSSIWWDASPSSLRARKTCCSATARMISASCIRPARTVHSSGSGRPHSSITVLIFVDCHDLKLVWPVDFYWNNFDFCLVLFRLSAKLQGNWATQLSSTCLKQHFSVCVSSVKETSIILPPLVCFHRTGYGLRESVAGHRTRRRNLLLLWRWLFWRKQWILWMLHMWTVGATTIRAYFDIALESRRIEKTWAHILLIARFVVQKGCSENICFVA